MQYLTDTLASGLQMIMVPMDGVKSLTVLALVRVGSRYENPEVAGVSHLLEHMVFKGTNKYPTAQEVAVSVDSIGAEFNAFTSKEYTGYYVKSASKDIEISLDVVSDMLLTPKLRQEDIDREKGVIIEELNMYEDTPMRHISDVFERMFYADSPLGRDIIGTRETVKGMNREMFVHHLEKWYSLKNMVLMIVGDSTVVKAAGLKSRVEHYFSKQPELTHVDTPQPDFITNPVSDGPRVELKYKKTEQAHFILAFPGIKRQDPDRYILNVLSTILGGNMSSRLFTEVREKRGLCYYVHSDQDYYHDAGMFGRAAGVDPSRVDEAIQVTYGEFLDLISGKKPITEAELKRAKDFTTGHLILGMEDSDSVAQSYGLKYLLEGKVTTLDEVIAKIASVTLDDVNKVAQRLIKPDQVRLAMIGPFEDPSRFAKLVGIS